MTTAELARLALETLDAQQVYFRAVRDGESAPQSRAAALEASKQLERRLRKAAGECLDGQGRLFGGQG